MRQLLEGTMTRRSFVGTATGAAIAIRSAAAATAEGPKPNSNFGGVRIGCNTYSFRGEIFTAEDTLKALVDAGLSEVELKEGPIQAFTGLSGVGRNSPCPCGSGQKYKRCCGVNAPPILNNAA